MKQKYVKFTAALLSLALLFSVLAVPASALNISTGIVRTDGAPSGMTLWLTVGSTLLYTGAVDDLEAQWWMDAYEDDIRDGQTVVGTEYIYDSYQTATLDWNAYAGLSQEDSNVIYWYTRTDYGKWIKGLKTADVDWTDGTITLADGTQYTPCDSGKVSKNTLTGSVAGFTAQGATVLLMAGGVAAFVVAVKLYDDPTILENAKQKARDFLGGITDTVQSWLPHAAPTEEPATDGDAAQPAQSDTPAA
jgi:hypothetical protein